MNVFHEFTLRIKTLENNFRASKQNVAVRQAFAPQQAVIPFEKKETLYWVTRGFSAFVILVLLVSMTMYIKNRTGRVKVDIGYSVKQPALIEKETETIVAKPETEKTVIKPEKEKVAAKPEKEKNMLEYQKKNTIVPLFDDKEKYVILVNKKSKELLLLENRRNNMLGMVERFSVSTGKIRGDKEKEGDLKTPEGMYRIVNIKEDDELTDIYGPLAFVLNYPNERDKKAGKTGSNIWIHGTGMIDQVTPDTKGCVEITDRDILKLSQYIGVETSVVIFPDTYNVLNDFEGDSIHQARIREILSMETKI